MEGPEGGGSKGRGRGKKGQGSGGGGGGKNFWKERAKWKKFQGNRSDSSGANAPKTDSVTQLAALSQVDNRHL